MSETLMICSDGTSFEMVTAFLECMYSIEECNLIAKLKMSPDAFLKIQVNIIFQRICS